MMQPRLGSHSLPVVQASNPAVFVPLCIVVQYFQTQEMLGMYGRSPTSWGNYYIATGDSGHIMTHGALAGMIISGKSMS